MSTARCKEAIVNFIRNLDPNEQQYLFGDYDQDAIHNVKKWKRVHKYKLNETTIRRVFVCEAYKERPGHLVPSTAMIVDQVGKSFIAGIFHKTALGSDYVFQYVPENEELYDEDAYQIGARWHYNKEGYFSDWHLTENSDNFFLHNFPSLDEVEEGVFYIMREEVTPEDLRNAGVIEVEVDFNQL